MAGRIYLYPYAGPGGRHYFKQIGTREDLNAEGVTLHEGMRLQFWCGDADDDGNPDDLLFEGTVHFDTERQEWYALIDESSYRHASDG